MPGRVWGRWREKCSPEGEQQGLADASSPSPRAPRGLPPSPPAPWAGAATRLPSASPALPFTRSVLPPSLLLHMVSPLLLFSPLQVVSVTLPTPRYFSFARRGEAPQSGPARPQWLRGSAGPARSVQGRAGTAAKTGSQERAVRRGASQNSRPKCFPGVR